MQFGRHLYFHVGHPEVSQRLGLVEAGAASASAATHAADADAELAAQLAGLSVTQQAASAAGGDCDGLLAALGAPSIEYLRYSIESGVAAGFQLAAAAGPLCDEPLWGVAFEVSARVNLPPAEQPGAPRGSSWRMVGPRSQVQEAP